MFFGPIRDVSRFRSTSPLTGCEKNICEFEIEPLIDFSEEGLAFKGEVMSPHSARGGHLQNSFGCDFNRFCLGADIGANNITPFSEKLLEGLLLFPTGLLDVMDDTMKRFKTHGSHLGASAIAVSLGSIVSKINKSRLVCVKSSTKMDLNFR